MSRTYKDRPSRLGLDSIEREISRKIVKISVEYPHYYNGEWVTTSYMGTAYLDVAGVKLKKKRSYVGFSQYWYRMTPSWWTKMFMLRPARRRANNIVNQLHKFQVEDLEDVDVPDLRKKPHIYYW